MPCLLTSDIEFCDFSIGGVKQLFITNRVFIDSIKFDNDNEGKIKTFIPVSGQIWWLLFEHNQTSTTISENLDKSNQGKGFRVDLSTSFIQLSKEKRESLSQLIDGDVVVVVEDFNGKFWALGDEDGLELTRYNATSEAEGGTSSYSITLSGFQLHQIREVNLDTVKAFWVAVEDCSIYAGQPISAIPPPLASIYDCLVDFSN